MVNRILSVGDDFTLRTSVNVADVNLPAASKAAAIAAKLDATQKGAASGVAPLDSGSRVAEANLPAGLAAAALTATFLPKWKATTAYLAGVQVVAPTGEVVSAKVDFTSGASFSAANWNFPVSSSALVYSGGAYPARPSGAVAVTYIGPVQPTTWLANDSWVDNS